MAETVLKMGTIPCQLHNRLMVHIQNLHKTPQKQNNKKSNNQSVNWPMKQFPNDETKINNKNQNKIQCH